MKATGATQTGFSLLELMVATAIIGILAAIAIPSYTSYVVRGYREAAQAELLRLAAIEEKIYLNSNAYSLTIANPYNGTNAGANGLGGVDAKLTARYTFTIAPTTGTNVQTFTLTATPVPGSKQASDGTLQVDEKGIRQWTKGAYTTSW